MNFQGVDFSIPEEFGPICGAQRTYHEAPFTTEVCTLAPEHEGDHQPGAYVVGNRLVRKTGGVELKPEKSCA